MANHKQNLVYVPLEPYQSRYTAELKDWETEVFSSRFNVSAIVPELKNSSEHIHSGEVLDCVRRPQWALNQSLRLLDYAPSVGKTYFSDFFHPGLEVLAYSRSEFSAFSFCWAQTFDQYDFTRRMFINWMRPWEVMALELYSGVFVACPELADLIITAVPHVAHKIHVVGLPYNSSAVFRKANTIATNREFAVVYSSRWDTEKNPRLFLELAEAFPNEKFLVCTGHPQLQGTDVKAIEQAKRMAQDGRLTIYHNLSRSAYYSLLSLSQVQFNCALQDWISFTLLDALTFGCMPLYPAFRSFPQALNYDDSFLYTPRDVGSAASKLANLLSNRPPQTALLSSSVLGYHNETLNRIASHIYEFVQ